MASPPAGRYSPSPRPTYTEPTLIQHATVRRHIWGDRESGLVADWLYASTDRLHVLLFGLAPGKAFRHSPAYRTVFGADEVLVVLSGSMLAANPENGEMLLCQRGDSLCFRRDTWHHAFANGPEPLRVIEFFAPPPSTGASGAYAAQRPYLEQSRYARDEVLGSLTQPAALKTLQRLSPTERSWRREGELSVGLISSTEQLTVAEIQADAGAQGQLSAHGGDALLFGTQG